MKIIDKDKTVKSNSEVYELYLGTFIDNAFTWYSIKKFKNLEEAYKEYKKYVNTQLKYTDEELQQVWDTGRLDIELRQGNKLLNWVGIYSREVKDLTKEEEKEVEKGEVKKEKKDSVEDAWNKFANETDTSFLKEAIAEMKRYERNWSFMTAKEKQNIHPEGLTGLKQELKFAEDRLKELEMKKDSIKDNPIDAKQLELIKNAKLVMDPDSHLDMMELFENYHKEIDSLVKDFRNGNMNESASGGFFKSFHNDNVWISVWFDLTESKNKIFLFGDYYNKDEINKVHELINEYESNFLDSVDFNTELAKLDDMIGSAEESEVVLQCEKVLDLVSTKDEFAKFRKAFAEIDELDRQTAREFYYMIQAKEKQLTKNS